MQNASEYKLTIVPEGRGQGAPASRARSPPSLALRDARGQCAAGRGAPGAGRGRGAPSVRARWGAQESGSPGGGEGAGHGRGVGGAAGAKGVSAGAALGIAPGADVVIFTETRLLPVAAPPGARGAGSGEDAADEGADEEPAPQEWRLAIVDAGAVVDEQDCTVAVRVHGKRVQGPSEEHSVVISVEQAKVRGPRPPAVAHALAARR